MDAETAAGGGLITAPQVVNALTHNSIVGLDDNTAEGADASEDETGRGTSLVAFGLRANPGGVGQGHNTNYVPVAFGHRQGLDPQASEDVTPTLRTGGGGAGVSVAAAVRRLTPVECERLQGFPDGWTAKRAELVLSGNRWTASGVVSAASDSARYRQLGNSIAVPVFAWVAQRMGGVRGDA